MQEDFERRVEVIKKLIDDYKKLGFDNIRIPGGTNKTGDYFSGIFPYFFDKERKKIFFLGVPYNSKFYKLGGVGGSHNKRAGENKEMTALRELYEETGLQAKMEDLEYINDFPVPDKDDNSKTHHKYFWGLHVSNPESIVSFISTSNPIDAETASPLWIPANLFKEVLFFGHKEAFKECINKLCFRNREYCDSLMNLFNS